MLGTGYAISHSECHCEERSDAAILPYKDEMATLPSVARNDIVKIYIVFILVYFSSYTILFYLRKVGLINQTPTILLSGVIRSDGCAELLLIVVNYFFDSIFQAVSGAETEIFLCFG